MTSSPCQAHLPGCDARRIVQLPCRQRRLSNSLPVRSRRKQLAQPARTAASSSNAGHQQSAAAQSAAPEGIAEPMSQEQVLSEQQQRKKLWFAAVKPPMYTVSIIPIAVAAAAAYSASGWLSMSKFLQLNIASILIIAWLNLSNDAFDADMNVDGNKPESVVNLTGNRNGVLAAAWACFAVGGTWLWSLVTGQAVQGDPRLACLLGAAISLGYLYQGPPFRLSYKGLGEPLCFVAFGPLATSAFFLAQIARPSGAVAADINAATVVSSIVVGITTSLILFCSHFHQIEDDRAAHKMSPVVRLGTANGVKVLQLALAAVYALVAVSMFTGWLPAACFGALCLVFPVVRDFLFFAEMNHTDLPVIRILKLHCIKVHTSIGLALAVGLVAPQLLTSLV